jgi:hypothetical protein
MNIKQALKRKNKLAGLIAEEFQKAQNYNSIEEGNPRPYSATESIKKWMELIDELVDLKTKIHTANVPVYSKIFRLSEIKSQVKYLKSLNCASGKETSRWSNNGESVIKHSEINIVERDNMVKDLEEQIELIQDELDVHNHTTII